MSFVAATHADQNPATSLACNKPTGTVDNDYMLALVKRVSEAAPTTVPTGWTLLADNLVGGGNSVWLYGKLASSEGASYTWTWADSLRTGITIATYRGDFDTADPIDVVSNTAYTTSNTTVRAASVSAAAANSVIVFAGTVHGSAAVTFTAPSVPASFSEDVDTQGDGSGRFSRTFARLAWTGSGATGDMEATASAAVTDKHAFAVIFNPPAASYTLPVDQGSLTLQGQSIGMNLTTTITAGQLALGPSIIGTLFDQAYTISIVHTPLALEGQDIPFIMTQPGSHGQLVLEGQEVGMITAGVMAVDVGQLTLQGQDVAMNLTMNITAGQLALRGYNVITDWSQAQIEVRRTKLSISISISI